MSAAGPRVRRLLALLPWVAAHNGPTVDEVCARFEISPAELTRDVELVAMVGVPPYTPGDFFEIVIEDGRVWVHLSPSFDRPLRLTPEEGLTLVAAGAGILATPGADPTGPLARGLDKLAAVLDVDPDTALDVRFGHAQPTIVAALQAAAAERARVAIDYYSHGRDERSERAIDPYGVFHAQGEWYVEAFDHLRGEDRVFRVDRVISVEPTGESFDAPDAVPSLAVFAPSADDPRVVLDLDADAAWVTEAYPVDTVDPQPDGRQRVTLAVSARQWLERLLLRAGEHARVVDVTGDARLRDAGADAARRVLARYGNA